MPYGHAKVEGLCPYCEKEYHSGVKIGWAPTGAMKGIRFHEACLQSWQSDRKWIAPEVLLRVESHRMEVYRKYGYDFKPRTTEPSLPSTTEVDIDTPEVTPDVETIPGTPFARKPEYQKPAKASSKPASDNGITQAIIDAIWPTIEGHITSSVDMSQVEQFVESKLKDFTSPEPKSITFQVIDSPSITVDTPHPLLPKLVHLMLKRHIPYLYNGAGSGKTHAAIQAATIAGCEKTYLVPCNPFSSPIELTGYTDALGKLVDKPLTLALRMAMEGKKVCLILDEADSARPDFLPTLNGIIAQKMLTLSNGELLTLPDTFYLILTGNTPMKGADKAYNSRARQDASVQDRLWFMYWHHDEALELSICNNLAGTKGLAWGQYCQSIRHYVKSDSTVADIHVTLRAMLSGISELCDPTSPFDVSEIADALIFKGCSDDTRKRILAAHPLPTGVK